MLVALYIIAIVIATSVVVSGLPSTVKKIIRNILVAVVAVSLFTVLFGGVLYGALAEAPEGYYPRAAVVVELDYSTNTIVVEDGAGLLWPFEGIEDFDV
jgi:cell division protein FtsX